MFKRKGGNILASKYIYYKNSYMWELNFTFHVMIVQFGKNKKILTFVYPKAVNDSSRLLPYILEQTTINGMVLVYSDIMLCAYKYAT